MRCRCGRPAVLPHREVVATAAHDPDFAGIGSSYYLGDTGGFLPIPEFGAERIGGNDHLYRLTPTIEVPSGEIYRIVHIWNYVTIREELFVEDGENDDWTSVLEREVVSPGWHFTDTPPAVFALRILTGSPQMPSLSNVAEYPAPSTSRNPFGGAPAKLIGFPGPFPALGGKPPGVIVGSLGTQRFQIFPLLSPYGSQDLGIMVPGPATIEYYGWVRQTNPDTRPVRPPPEEDEPAFAGQRPEDDFVQTHVDVRWGHIGAALTYEREYRRTCQPCGGCNDCCSCPGEQGRRPWWRKILGGSR